VESEYVENRGFSGELQADSMVADLGKGDKYQTRSAFLGVNEMSG